MTKCTVIMYYPLNGEVVVHRGIRCGNNGFWLFCIFMKITNSWYQKMGKFFIQPSLKAKNYILKFKKIYIFTYFSVFMKQIETWITFYHSVPPKLRQYHMKARKIFFLSTYSLAFAYLRNYAKFWILNFWILKYKSFKGWKSPFL